MLKDSEEFEVVGQARDGVEAVSAASELSPDVIVMDVIMPGKDGVEACREDHGVCARHAGEMQVPPEVVRRVFARIRREAKLEEEQDELTGREKEMLVSFCRGMSYT